MLNYERLCEFFFDLCVSWCQFLDIETFLFFLHALFLNVRLVNLSDDKRRHSCFFFFQASRFYRSDASEILQFAAGCQKQMC